MPRQPIVFRAVGPFRTLCLIRKRFGSMLGTWCRGLLGRKTSCIDHLIVGDLPVKVTGRVFAPVSQWSSRKPMFGPPHNAESASKIWPKSVRCIKAFSPISVAVISYFESFMKKGPLPIPAPVGMYNLGNTCYLSSTLQALIHCVPLQRYFLEDVGHCHEACMLFKTCTDASSGPSAVIAGQYVKMRALCLACEMDRLYTIYESSANGYATWQKGSPLVTANILSSCWRAMEHLAGSEQRDAHEFLHGFLELVGKNMSTFRAEVRTSLGDVALVKTDDKKDGTLDAVLHETTSVAWSHDLLPR
jgi:Ubiquitin carboxyl-terminal hydrolase